MPEQDKVKTYRNPLPATDIIIEYNDGQKQGIVLITRKNEPYGIALPGGFAEYGISFEQNAEKEAKEETNLDVIIQNPENPLCVHSNPERDPRHHIVSITYIAKGTGKLKAGDDAKEAKLYSYPELADLVMKEVVVLENGRIERRNKEEKSEVFAFNDHPIILMKYLIHRGF
jgi:8-oxo-dGTP diphosphatase